MTIKGRLVISYIIGLAAGSVATYICVKDYYKNIADEEIASVKETIMKRAAKLYSDKAEETIKNFERSEVDVDPKVSPKYYDEDSYDENEKATNYSKYYQGGGEVTEVLNSLAEKEHPEDDIPEAATKKSKKSKKKAPRIIKSEDYDEYPEYRKMTIYYYAEDEVLADEAEDLEYEDMTGKKLGKYSDLVGNCISKYGFDVNDETVIFVRNEEIGVDFEIQKDFGAFADLQEEDI